MTRNLGGFDKGLRIGVGVLLLALGLSGRLGWWGAIGLVPLLIGLVGNCPLYSILGFNTCRWRRAKGEVPGVIHGTGA